MYLTTVHFLVSHILALKGFAVNCDAQKQLKSRLILNRSIGSSITRRDAPKHTHMHLFLHEIEYKTPSLMHHNAFLVNTAREDIVLMMWEWCCKGLLPSPPALLLLISTPHFAITHEQISEVQHHVLRRPAARASGPGEQQQRLRSGRNNSACYPLNNPTDLLHNTRAEARISKQTNAHVQ